jgi:hypothetical protein
MAEVVDGHRAPVTPLILVGTEHEVVDEQLSAALEQIEQGGLAVRALEHVRLVDEDARQPATLGGERIACARGFLFLGEELVASRLPLVL